MKTPAVAMVTAFAWGIAIGSWPVIALHAFGRIFLALGLAVAILSVGAAFLLVFRGHVRAAGATSLATWLVLGISGAAIANQPKPANYILNVLNAGEIDVHTPLRWHGMLRDEPQHYRAARLMKSN